jgi:hypothetical protein
MHASAATYYIDWTGGNDSNNGTSTATPWKRHPYMATEAVTYTHAAGDRFIFKGGETWPASCFNMDISAWGTSANWDVYTSDPAWYSGGSFTRPIFDFELADLTTRQVGIYGNGLKYIHFSDIELKRFKGTGTPWNGAMFTTESAQNLVLSNVWMHWFTSTASQDVGGGYYGNNNSVELTNVVIINSRIDNDEGAGNLGTALRQVSIIFSNQIGNFPNIINMSGEVIASNFLYNCNPSVDAGSHENLAYVANWQGVNFALTRPAYIIGNIASNIVSGSDGGAAGECWYLEPTFGAANNDGVIYFYNNITLSIGSGVRAVEFDTEDADAIAGTAYIWNNTFHGTNSLNDFVRMAERTYNGKLLDIRNNHFISDKADVTETAGADTVVEANNLLQTLAQAASEGYTIANLFQPGTGDTTIDYGQTIATVGVDRTGTSRPQNSIYDAGAWEFVVEGGAPAASGNGGSTISGSVTIAGGVTIK